MARNGQLSWCNFSEKLLHRFGTEPKKSVPDNFSTETSQILCVQVKPAPEEATNNYSLDSALVLPTTPKIQSTMGVERQATQFYSSFSLPSNMEEKGNLPLQVGDSFMSREESVTKDYVIDDDFVSLESSDSSYFGRVNSNVEINGVSPSCWDRIWINSHLLDPGGLRSGVNTDNYLMIDESFVEPDELMTVIDNFVVKSVGVDKNDVRQSVVVYIGILVNSLAFESAIEYRVGSSVNFEAYFGKSIPGSFGNDSYEFCEFMDSVNGHESTDETKLISETRNDDRSWNCLFTCFKGGTNYFVWRSPFVVKLDVSYDSVSWRKELESIGVQFNVFKFLATSNDNVFKEIKQMNDHAAREVQIFGTPPLVFEQRNSVVDAYNMLRNIPLGSMLVVFFVFCECSLTKNKLEKELDYEGMGVSSFPHDPGGASNVSSMIDDRSITVKWSKVEFDECVPVCVIEIFLELFGSCVSFHHYEGISVMSYVAENDEIDCCNNDTMGTTLRGGIVLISFWCNVRIRACEGIIMSVLCHHYWCPEIRYLIRIKSLHSIVCLKDKTVFKVMVKVELSAFNFILVVVSDEAIKWKILCDDHFYSRKNSRYMTAKSLLKTTGYALSYESIKSFWIEAFHPNCYLIDQKIFTWKGVISSILQYVKIQGYEHESSKKYRKQDIFDFYDFAVTASCTVCQPRSTSSIYECPSSRDVFGRLQWTLEGVEWGKSLGDKFTTLLKHAIRFSSTKRVNKYVPRFVTLLWEGTILKISVDCSSISSIFGILLCYWQRKVDYNLSQRKISLTAVKVGYWLLDMVVVANHQWSKSFYEAICEKFIGFLAPGFAREVLGIYKVLKMIYSEEFYSQFEVKRTQDVNKQSRDWSYEVLRINSIDLVHWEMQNRQSTCAVSMSDVLVIQVGSSYLLQRKNYMVISETIEIQVELLPRSNYATRSLFSAMFGNLYALYVTFGGIDCEEKNKFHDELHGFDLLIVINGWKLANHSELKIMNDVIVLDLQLIPDSCIYFKAWDKIITTFKGDTVVFLWLRQGTKLLLEDLVAPFSPRFLKF